MIDNDLARLSRNLKTARTAKGITQPEAAAEVSKTRQTIVNWENPANPAEPSSAELATLARLYGVTPRDLRFEELERQAAAPRMAAGRTVADELDAKENAPRKEAKGGKKK
jgi:transcriptional regulator with XRE-family HTH domain